MRYDNSSLEPSALIGDRAKTGLICYDIPHMLMKLVYAILFNVDGEVTQY